MKKIAITLTSIALFICFALVYVNWVLLPTKISSLIVKSLEDYTGKKVILGSVSLNPFKGLVLRDLIIYDHNTAILNSKEASFLFLVQPVFKKQIIIPSITIESPHLFVERSSDNTVNIIETFFGKPAPVLKSGFSVLLNKVVVHNARVSFHDNAVSGSFSKEFTSLDLDLALRLPYRIRFDMKCKIPSGMPTTIKSSGEYDMSSKELIADIKAVDLEPVQFSAYYSSSGFSFPDGTVDGIAGLHYKEGMLEVSFTSETQALSVIKGAVSAKLNSEIRGEIKYSTTERQLTYSGAIDLSSAAISGVPFIDKADEIKGKIEFSQKGFSSGTMSGVIFGAPANWKIGVADYENPSFDISVSSRMKLGTLRSLLIDKFNVSVPFDIEGDGDLALTAIYDFSAKSFSKLNGSVEMADTVIKAAGPAGSIESINGRFHYSLDRLSWKDVRFKRNGVEFTATGELVNFSSPGVQLDLRSKDIEADCIFSVDGKTLRFSRLKGRYFNTGYVVTGSAEFTTPSGALCRMNGVLNADLEDIKKAFRGAKDSFDRAKVEGKVRADFSIAGNIGDLKACFIDAKIFSSSLVLYGIRPVSTIIEYNQSGGIGEIRRLHSFLYGGTLDATGRMMLSQAHPSYTFNLALHGIRIEKLRADTMYKDADIRGTMHLRTRISGYLDDISRLTGTGKLSIVDGKLWQLNLLKGLGALIFTSGFSNVVFKDGYCDFFIKDRAVYTDNLRLTSDLIDMQGGVRIRFDSSVDAALKTEMKGSAMAYSSRKDLAETVQKYSTIEIKGTLKEPRFRIKPNVVDFLLDFKDRYFNQ